MNTPSVCPKCGAILLPNTNFCPNCGYEVSTASQALSIGRQMWIYFVSLALPPLGLIWTFKYFHSPDTQKRRVALVATIITIVSLIATVWLTVGFFQGIQAQYNQIDTFSNQGL